MLFLKRTVAITMLSFFISTTLTPLPKYILFYRLNKQFHNTFTSTKSEHTTAYNVDSTYTEKVYLNVRKCIGVTYVNDKVIIVNVSEKLPTGSIGKIGEDEILGLYVQNIIYYDGTDLTLQHELAHFFYEKMKDKERSEMFAQAVEKFYLIVDIITKRR